MGLAGLVFLFLTVQGPGGGMSAGAPPDPGGGPAVTASPVRPTAGDGAGGAGGAGVTALPTVEGTGRDTVDASPRPSGEPPSPQDPVPVTWVPFFSGDVTLDESPLDLDRAPPQPGSAGDALAGVAEGQVYVGVGRAQSLAKAVPGSTVSSPEDCVDLFWATRPTPDRVPVAADDNLCLVTDEERVVLLYITATSAPAGTVAAAVEVWEQSAD